MKAMEVSIIRTYNYFFFQNGLSKVFKMAAQKLSKYLSASVSAMGGNSHIQRYSLMSTETLKKAGS